MLRPEEYLKRAEEAEAKAETVRDFDAKQTYLEIAKQWRELAKLAELQDSKIRPERDVRGERTPS
jgi:hypothetical protein